MGLGKRLFKHTVNFGLGSVLPKFIGFLLIPLYTIYLTPEDFGIVDLAASLGAFLMILMRLGVPGAVTRFYFDFKEGPELRNYLTTIFLFIVGASLLIGVLYLTLGEKLTKFLIPGLPFYPFVLLVVLGAIFQSNSDLQRRLMQAREQSAYSAKLSTATSLITILITIFMVVWWKMGALGIVLATTVSSFLFFIQAQYYLKPDLNGNFDRNLLKPSFNYAIGILPSHLSISFGPIVSKSLLSGFSSLTEVGILGIALRFTSPLTMVSNAFQNAYVPIYYSVREEGSSDGLVKLGTLSYNIWLFSCIIFLVVVFFSPMIIDYILPVEYTKASALIPYLAFGFLFQTLYILFGMEIFYSKKTYWSTLTSLINTFLNIIVTYFSVRNLGSIGAGIGIAVGNLASAVISIIISYRMVKIPRNNSMYLISFLSCVMLMALSHYINNYFQNTLIKILVFTLFILVFTINFFYSEILKKIRIKK